MKNARQGAELLGMRGRRARGRGARGGRVQAVLRQAPGRALATAARDRSRRSAASSECRGG